jgi:hypothetical protein
MGGILLPDFRLCSRLSDQLLRCFTESDVAFPVQYVSVSAETDTTPGRCEEKECAIQIVKVETVEEESIAEFELPPPPSEEKITSCATEAAGWGEIAEFAGETVDKMSAAAIEGRNSPLASCGNHDDDDADCDADDDRNAGSKIVDGEQDVDSEDSWTVVVNEFQNGDVDEREIARAVEAIGSALFHSDSRALED